METIRGQRVAAIAAGLGFGILLIAGIRERRNYRVHRPGTGQRGRKRSGARDADLHPGPVGLRTHQRASHHRGTRGDGPGSSRALRTTKDPEGDGGGALRQGEDIPPRCPIPVSMPVTAPSTRRHVCPTVRTRKLGRPDTSRGDLTRQERRSEPDNYLYLSAMLFTIGAAGMLLRRNAIVMFMCVELMLNAANLAFVTFSRVHGDLDGQVVAFFTMVVAACEVVVGLAIIATIFRTRRSANVDDAHLLRH